MQRFLYFAGFAFIALCGAMVVRQLGSRAVTGRVETAVRVAPVAPMASTSGARWFATMKPYCNPVEVDVRTRYSPAPDNSEGAGYAAACFALAGKIERARTIIESMPAGDR